MIKKIIILGDLKHEFGKISDLEWKEGIKLLDYLDNKVSSKNKTKGIVLIKGNHDNILGPIAKKRDIILKNYYKIDKICFMHGHKLWDACLEDVDRLIIGHLHPSVTLKDNYKKEKFRCFLRGKWKKKQVYILPGFSPISSGYDLRRLKYLHNLDDKKGFLIIGNDKLKKFEVIIYNKKEDKIHNFGKLMRFI